MPTPIRDATWAQIEALRDGLTRDLPATRTLATAAQLFVERLVGGFASVALARVFHVTALRRLPSDVQADAAAFASSAGRTVPLDASTPVLTLMGTAGDEPAWNDRTRSEGHRAIPLVDKRLVDGAPMIAALLAGLDVELAPLEVNGPIQLRFLSGGINARFYVPDARTTKDARGRLIIANEPFVANHGIRTVFGMGGAFLDGSLIASILFTREELSAAEVDRFPSFIGTFKIATGPLVEAGALLTSSTS